MINQHFLKLTIPTHCLLIFSFFTVDWTIWNAVGILVLWTLFGGFGVAVGYHRLFGHRSFEATSDSGDRSPTLKVV